MLSVFYIVKNEEKLLSKSIESILPIASEIIIVDTGSVDKTLSLCNKYKAITSSFPWCNDFSQARNYAIRLCKHPWIMFLDADEIIQEKSKFIISNAITNAGKQIYGFSLHINDHINSWDGELLPSTFFKSPQIRIFRSDKRIKFDGKVMESVNKSLQNIGGVDILDSSIDHFLWRGMGQEYIDNKIKYYNILGANLSFKVLGNENNVNSNNVSEKKMKFSKQEDVSIIMCAYNASEYTKKTISSINKESNIPFDLYLIDNGSSDDTINIMNSVDGATIIRLQKNEGVSKGRNIGAKEALNNPKLKYLVFIDNDIAVPTGWIQQMKSIMEDNPSIGILSLPTRQDFMNSIQLEEFKRYIIRSSLNEINRSIIDRPLFSCTEFVNGTCIMISIELIKKIGLFDESFGIYGYEDKDYCIRTKNAGFMVCVANRIMIDHYGGMSRSTTRLDWHSVLLTSRVRFEQKWKSKINTSISSPIPIDSKLNDTLFPNSKNNPNISIVVLAHNRLDMTKSCLESIKNFTKSYELIFVDNASTDGTPEWVKKEFPEAKLIINNKNLGVAKARNQGVKESKEDFIVLIDNDCIVDNGWIEDLLDGINNGASISGIEAWNLGSDNCPCGKCISYTNNFGYLGGACCLFKRSVFEEIGLFDEGFSPAYYEDVDICIRAKKKGLKLSWVNTSKIVHREHATLINGQKEFGYQIALRSSHERYLGKISEKILFTPEFLPKRNKKLKILYAAMYYDYGRAESGTSYEQDNFYPSFKHWSHTGELKHFDFVHLAQQYGIPKMSDMLVEEVYNFKPDVLFSIFFDKNHDPNKEAFTRIKNNTTCKTMNWFCDSHWRYDNFDSLWAPYLDFCITTAETAVTKYKTDGFSKKVIKSQWFASPLYRKITGIKKDIEVSFVGQPHGDRREVIGRLQSHGIKVNTFGTGWDTRLGFEEMIEMFNRSKINLNLNNASDSRYMQIKGRNFEVPACGGFLLTGAPENLNEYYSPGVEVVTYNNYEELEQNIRYYLSNEEERNSIANAGYQKTLKYHTFQNRFDDIFKMAGLL